MKVTLPNIHGHFGRISAVNHNLYEAYPAPIIALERVRREHDFRDGVDHLWELNNLRPANAVAAQPGVDGNNQEDGEDDDEFEEANGDAPQEADLDRIERAVAPQQRDAGHGDVLGFEFGIQGVEGLVLEADQQAPRRDMPTVNLLGWYPLQRWTQNQRMLYEHIAVDGPNIVHQQFRLCTDLMDAIGMRLRNLPNYKIASTMHKSASVE